MISVPAMPRASDAVKWLESHGVDVSGKGLLGMEISATTGEGHIDYTTRETYPQEERMSFLIKEDVK